MSVRQTALLPIYRDRLSLHVRGLWKLSSNVEETEQLCAHIA